MLYCQLRCSVVARVKPGGLGRDVGCRCWWIQLLGEQYRFAVIVCSTARLSFPGSGRPSLAWLPDCLPASSLSVPRPRYPSLHLVSRYGCHDILFVTVILRCLLLSRTVVISTFSSCVFRSRDQPRNGFISTCPSVPAILCHSDRNQTLTRSVARFCPSPFHTNTPRRPLRGRPVSVHLSTLENYRVHRPFVIICRWRGRIGASLQFLCNWIDSSYFIQPNRPWRTNVRMRQGEVDLTKKFDCFFFADNHSIAMNTSEMASRCISEVGVRMTTKLADMDQARRHAENNAPAARNTCAHFFTQRVREKCSQRDSPSPMFVRKRYRTGHSISNRRVYQWTIVYPYSIPKVTTAHILIDADSSVWNQFFFFNPSFLPKLLFYFFFFAHQLVPASQILLYTFDWYTEKKFQ